MWDLREESYFPVTIFLPFPESKPYPDYQCDQLTVPPTSVSPEIYFPLAYHFHQIISLLQYLLVSLPQPTLCNNLLEIKKFHPLCLPEQIVVSFQAMRFGPTKFDGLLVGRY